ncbi:MAG: TrkH family potassium uptake protein [Oligosphaeraceae bacterium]
MNSRSVLFTTSALMFILGMGMMAAIAVGLHRGDSLYTLRGFLGSAAICLTCSLTAAHLSRRPWSINQVRNSLRYGFFTISLAWFSSILLGALPFVLCCSLPLPDAIFETASGLSTTGASILDATTKLLGGKRLEGGLASLPQAILFWRQLLNWFGGIGFVMFALILLPALGGGKQLYNAEVPGLKNIFDQISPRIATTARIMLGCYVVWTAIVILAYRLGGMDSLFDAVCHTFSTVATGGFSPYPENFAHFPRPVTQWLCTAAMLISSLNQVLMVKLLFHRHFEYHRDEETRVFLAIFLASVCLIIWQIPRAAEWQITGVDGTPLPPSLENTVRTVAFHVAAIVSTTGFATCDYTQWAIPCLPMVFLFLLIVGGCGGSTAGGMKLTRLIVVFKQSIGEIRRKIFPHLLPNVTMNGQRLEMTSVHQCMAFFFLYLSSIFLCAFLLPLLSPTGPTGAPLDLETSVTTALSCLSNVGPGLGQISPSYTFSGFTAPAKLLMAFTMIAGRLELYAAFVLLIPSFWTRQGSMPGNRLRPPAPRAGHRPPARGRHS